MSLAGHPLIGTWCSLEETLSVVEYSVNFSNGIFGVSAVDSYDCERGEVDAVHWDDEKMELSFACYWASSGRYSKCRMRLYSDNKVDLTYTYTDHEFLVRKTV